MSIRSILSLFAVSTFALAGCNGSPLGSSDDDDDGQTPGHFHYQIPSFSVPAGTEFYQCFIVKAPTGGTASEDVGATRFAYTPGSSVLHHIIVFSGADSEVEGTRACELFEDGWNIRYAGGLVTDPLDTPPGVAVPVRDVETFVIQIHYLNAGDTAVIDTTTVDIDFTLPGVSFIKAGLVVSGNTNFEIPAGAVDYDVPGNCTVPAQLPAITVYAIWPHMHQKGTNFIINHERGATVTPIIDTPWQFGEQPIWKQAPELVVNPGDSIKTTCRYSNPGTAPITVGESSTQEMCFDFFFYYPAIVNQMIPCIMN